MNVHIFPSKISGSVSAPPSKSYTHRAIILAAMANGNSTISNCLISDDTLWTISACKALGAEVQIKGQSLSIKGINGKPVPTKGKKILCGLSGTTARLISAVASLSAEEVIIDCEGRLRSRPMGKLLDALSSRGTHVRYLEKKNCLPVAIKGTATKGEKIEIDASDSSQFVSALLLISPFAKSDTKIHVKNTRSAPYIDITVDLMRYFGVKITMEGNIYHIPASQQYYGRNYHVEGDYSSASYFFAAGALTRDSVTVSNLNPESKQGDKFFLKILSDMNCSVRIKENNVTVTRNANLKGINIDMGNYPDIVPSLAAVAPFAQTPTQILNIKHLRLKESDRIHTMAQELIKINVKTKEKKDTLAIFPSAPKGAAIETHCDHRIAMSLAVTALVAEGKTTIRNAGVVSKSYPDFWNDLKKIGAQLQIIV